MTSIRTKVINDAWSNRVRDSLRTLGYYYEPEFCTETIDAKPVVDAAKLLGRLHVPRGANREKPVIITQPSPSAPDWRPFDRRASIGWHNDFSTRRGRPELSLSWIRREDPDALSGGAWRVVSVPKLLAELGRTLEGHRLVSEFAKQAEAFGYRDAGGWYPFRIITKSDDGSGRLHSMRFYGRALEEGAWLRFGCVPERTREIVARIEEAADSVGEVLRASTGTLLIVDNRFSLHDRLRQQVTGPEDQRRQAWLCFVRRLHKPL
jgi:hypothetical protein